MIRKSLLVIDQRYQSIIAMALPGETRVLVRMLNWPLTTPFCIARHYLRFLSSVAPTTARIRGEARTTLSLLSGGSTRLALPAGTAAGFTAIAMVPTWPSAAGVCEPQPARCRHTCKLPAPQRHKGRPAGHCPTLQPPNNRSIHPGATKTYKMWHPEQFAALCQRLRRLGATDPDRCRARSRAD